MSEYRKKPVVIEAIQYDSRGQLVGTTVPGWYIDAEENGVVEYDEDEDILRIQTLEGNHTANQGDWIIKGVKGELYPCKPDIFALTYEPATPPPPSETKLSEAIQEFENRAIEWENIDPECDPSYEELARDKYVAARSSLESLYKELQDANDELETTVDLRYQEVLAGLRAELSALRSLQLTPAEARLVLHALETNGYAMSITNPIVEKLHISSKLENLRKVTP